MACPNQPVNTDTLQAVCRVQQPAGAAYAEGYAVGVVQYPTRTGFTCTFPSQSWGNSSDGLVQSADGPGGEYQVTLLCQNSEALLAAAAPLAPAPACCLPACAAPCLPPDSLPLMPGVHELWLWQWCGARGCIGGHACRAPHVVPAGLLVPYCVAGLRLLGCPAAGTITGVRLAAGSPPAGGRVEVQVAGQWGTVSALPFGNTEANLVCQALGYSGGRQADPSQLAASSLQQILDPLLCFDGEASLNSCNYVAWGNGSVDPSLQAAVQCNTGGWMDIGHNHLPILCCLALPPSMPTASLNACCLPCCLAADDITAVRLNSSRQSQGLLEVELGGGQWVTACPEGFTQASAQVACRMLGWYGGALLSGNYSASPDDSTSWVLEEAGCGGEESSLNACRLQTAGGACSAPGRVAISCSRGARRSGARPRPAPLLL